MSDSDLLRNPHSVNENFWWYEEKHGITVIVGGRLEKIPWRSIRAALCRKDSSKK